MAEFRVGCKVKHSLYERIESIGCVNTATGEEKRFSEDEAISRIENKTDSFFVEDKAGIRADVKVEEREGRKFLITVRDGVKDNNLLYLPECPAQKKATAGTSRSVYPSGSHCVWLRHTK